MHGPIHVSYHQRTNFKNFGDQVCFYLFKKYSFSDLLQILAADHQLLVSGLIRSNLNALDEYLENSQPDPEDKTATTCSFQTINSNSDSNEYDKVRELGSQAKPCSFLDLEKAHQADHAFRKFRINLGKFMTTFLQLYNIIPSSGQVKFHRDDLVRYRDIIYLIILVTVLQVIEYHYLKVKYNCLSDWQLKTDHLRCNPTFHGHPRYDCVLVHSSPHPYIARLICLFTCTVDGKEYPLALVQPYSLSPTTNLGQAQKNTDIDLELLRLQENFRSECEFVSIHSIIRGTVLVHSDEETSNGMASCDYFLFDLLDADMFLRGRELLEQRKTEQGIWSH